MRSDEPGIESHPHRGQGEGAFMSCPPLGLQGADEIAN
jgi:hypothetical protein